MNYCSSSVWFYRAKSEWTMSTNIHLHRSYTYSKHRENLFWQMNGMNSTNQQIEFDFRQMANHNGLPIHSNNWIFFFLSSGKIVKVFLACSSFILSHIVCEILNILRVTFFHMHCIHTPPLFATPHSHNTTAKFYTLVQVVHRILTR